MRGRKGAGCARQCPWVRSGRSRAGRAVGWVGGTEPAPGAGAHILRASRPSAASGSGGGDTRCPLGEDDEVRARWRDGQQRGSGCLRAAEKSTEGFFLLANAL